MKKMLMVALCGTLALFLFGCGGGASGGSDGSTSDAPQQEEQHGRDDGADRLQRPERGFVPDERHDQHRRRRDDVSLGDPLQDGKAHHLVPQHIEDR